MPRTANTYNCFLQSVSTSEWEKLAGGVASTAEALEFLNKEKTEAETPSEATGLKTATNKKKVIGKFKMPTLAEGEIPKAARLHIYAKTGSAAVDIMYTIAGVKGELSSIKTEWYKTILTSIEGKTLAELETWEIESVKAQGGTVYAFYLELETETERSNILTTQGANQAFTGAASAGGVVEVQVSAGIPVGSTVSLIIAGIASGATSVSDPHGNTYTKDLEQVFTGVTVQFWSAQVGTELKSTDKITCSGFTALTKVTANANAMFGFQSGIGATAIDVSATVEGVGETFEVATANTRTTQGDLLRGCFVALGEATSLSTAGSSQEVTPDPGGVQKEAGLSMLGNWAKRPPEGSAATVKGKWNTSLTYAGVVVAYKVLATSETTVAALAMMV